MEKEGEKNDGGRRFFNYGKCVCVCYLLSSIRMQETDRDLRLLHLLLTRDRKRTKKTTTTTMMIIMEKTREKTEVDVMACKKIKFICFNWTNQDKKKVYRTGFILTARNDRKSSPDSFMIVDEFDQQQQSIQCSNHISRNDTTAETKKKMIHPLINY